MRSLGHVFYLLVLWKRKARIIARCFSMWPKRHECSIWQRESLCYRRDSFLRTIFGEHYLKPLGLKSETIARQTIYNRGSSHS